MTDIPELSIPPGAEFDALAAPLVGRTIAKVTSHVDDSEPWTDHGHVNIELDDGTMISCGGWGHDAWGPHIIIIRDNLTDTLSG